MEEVFKRRGVLGPCKLDTGVEGSYLGILQLPELHPHPSPEQVGNIPGSSESSVFPAKHICEVLDKEIEGSLKQPDSSCNATEHGASDNLESSGGHLASDTTMTE